MRGAGAAANQAAPRGSPPRKVETTVRFPIPTARKQQMVPGTEIGLRPLLSTFTIQCGSNIEGEQEVCTGDGRGRKPCSRRSPPSSQPHWTEGKGDRAGRGHVPDRHRTDGRNEARVSKSGQAQAAEASDQLALGTLVQLFWPQGSCSRSGSWPIFARGQDGVVGLGSGLQTCPGQLDKVDIETPREADVLPGQL